MAFLGTIINEFEMTPSSNISEASHRMFKSDDRLARQMPFIFQKTPML